MGLIRLVLTIAGAAAPILALVIIAISSFAQNFIKDDSGFVSGLFAGCILTNITNGDDYECWRGYSYLRKGSYTEIKERLGSRSMKHLNDNNNINIKEEKNIEIKKRINKYIKDKRINKYIKEKRLKKKKTDAQTGKPIEYGLITKMGDIIDFISDMLEKVEDIEDIEDIEDKIGISFEDIEDKTDDIEDTIKKLQSFKPISVIDNLVYVNIFELYFDSNDSSEISAIHVMQTLSAILLIAAGTTGALGILFNFLAYISSVLSFTAATFSIISVSMLTYYINEDKENFPILSTDSSFEMAWVSTVIMLIGALLMGISSRM